MPVDSGLVTRTSREVRLEIVRASLIHTSIVQSAYNCIGISGVATLQSYIGFASFLLAFVMVSRLPGIKIVLYEFNIMSMLVDNRCGGIRRYILLFSEVKFHYENSE